MNLTIAVISVVRQRIDRPFSHGEYHRSCLLRKALHQLSPRGCVNPDPWLTLRYLTQPLGDDLPLLVLRLLVEVEREVLLVEALLAEVVELQLPGEVPEKIN